MNGNALLDNGNMVRGDTYYFSKGNYGNVSFSQATSGSSLITIKVATVTDYGQGCSLSGGWDPSTFAVNGIAAQAVLPASFQVTTDYWVFDGTTPASGTGIGCSALGSASGCGFKVNNACTDSTCSTSKALGFYGASSSHITVQYFEYAGASSGTVGVDIDQGETRNLLASPGGASCAGGVVTLATDQPHRYMANQFIVTTSATLGGFTNGTVQISSVPSSTTLTFPASCTNSATGGGGSIAATSGGMLPEEGPRFINGSSNISLLHNYIHGVDGVPITLDGASNVIVDHNWVYLTAGQNTAHSHLQGIQLAGGTVGSSNLTITNNAFQDIDGAGCVVGLDDGAASKTISSVTIAGNLCFDTPNNPNKRAGLSNGSFVCFNSIACNNWEVAGNTVVGIVAYWGPTSATMSSPIASAAVNVGVGVTTTGWITENNIFCGSSGLGNSTGAGLTVDYNFYCNDNSGTSHPAETHGQDAALSASQVFAGYVSSDLRLMSDTTAYDSAHSVSPDPLGIIRTSSRGAYQYVPPITSSQFTAGSMSGTFR